MIEIEPQSNKEIVKGLESMVNRKDLLLSSHLRASLWNAIEILEDMDAIKEYKLSKLSKLSKLRITRLKEANK